MTTFKIGMVTAEKDMPNRFRVLQIGFGSLGKGLAKAIISRSNLELIAIVDVDPQLQGKRLDELLSLDSSLTLKVRSSLQEVLSELKNRPADVALVLTTSSLQAVAPTIRACLRAGLHVVSLCEELSYPFERHPELAGELDRLARRVGRTILGTGINPGYLMDLLPILLTAPCQSVERIHVTRHMNSIRRRPSFQKKIGTGMTPQAFREAITQKKITGHVGLLESVHMIDAALNLGLDEVEELAPEPVVASVDIVTPVGAVGKGGVVGLKSAAVGRMAGHAIVTLDFIAFAGASPEYDEVLIEGRPNIRERIEGGVQGDVGTIAMIMNVVPLVTQTKPGLLTMKDIPCPRNTERVWKAPASKRH